MVNEADMDFRIAGLPHSVVKHAQRFSVRQLIQKIENQPDRHALQQDLRKVKHLSHIVQNQNKLFRMWVTSNYVNCARWNPKRSAHRVLTYWNMVSSFERARISCTEKQRSIGNSSTLRWTFFQSLCVSSRREDLMDTDMGKSQDTKNIWLTNRKRNAKREFQGIHDRFLRYQEFFCQ